jgi:hypothetical protein
MEDTFVSDYDVVVGDKADALESRVKERLRQGWELQGGVSITGDTNTREYRYVQAMIKVDPIQR